MKKRFLHLRRLLRLIPKLLKALDILEELQPKLERDLIVLEETIKKFRGLDECLSRIESLGKEKPPVAAAAVVHRNGNGSSERHGWARLELLAKFVNLSGKAHEIEQEWQRVQQDEHNEHFAFQVLRGNNEGIYLYKKGVTEGIKWCVDRFC